MKKNFSSSEVAVLIENFDSKLSIVSEEVSGFSTWRDKTDTRLDNIEARLTAVEDVVKVAIPSLSKRVTTLEKKAG